MRVLLVCLGVWEGLLRGFESERELSEKAHGWSDRWQPFNRKRPFISFLASDHLIIDTAHFKSVVSTRK